MERLLEVGDAHQLAFVAQRGDRLVGRQRDAGRVRRGNVRVLTPGRKRSSEDLLRNSLVGDACNVVDAHPGSPFGNVQILATQLQTARGVLGIVRLDRRQPQLTLLVLREPVGIRVLVQVAADHRLRFLPFRDLHRGNLLFLADPRVVSDEVDEVGPLQQELRHDRVVVILPRDVAVAAGLGFGSPLGVRIMRRERLRREPGRGDRRLLNIDALAIDVGRRKHQRRARAYGRDLAPLDRPVVTELEHIVARDLRIIGGVIARLASFVVQAIGPGVRLDRQVTAGARRRP